MSDPQLEQQLAAWYRARIPDSMTPPATLYDAADALARGADRAPARGMLLLVAAAVTVAVLAASVATVAGWLPWSSEPPNARPSLPAYQLPAELMGDRVIADVKVPEPNLVAFHLGRPVVAGHYVWFTEQELFRVDPASNRASKVNEPGTAFGAEWVLAADDGLWLSSATVEETARVDTQTGVALQAFDLGGSMAAAGGTVWIATHDGSLLRHDASDEAFKRVANLPHIGVPVLAYADGSLWASWGQQGLYRIDPADGSVLARLPDAGAPVAAEGDELWVDVPYGIANVDTRTNTLVTTVELGPVRTATLSPSRVWVETDSNLLYSIDRTSHEASAYQLPGTQSSSRGIAYGDGSLWITHWVGRSGDVFVWRIRAD